MLTHVQGKMNQLETGRPNNFLDPQAMEPKTRSEKQGVRFDNNAMLDSGTCRAWAYLNEKGAHQSHSQNQYTDTGSRSAVNREYIKIVGNA